MTARGRRSAGLAVLPAAALLAPLLLASACDPDPASDEGVSLETVASEDAGSSAASDPSAASTPAPGAAAGATASAVSAQQLVRWLVPRQAEWLAARAERARAAARDAVNGAPQLRVQLPRHAHEPFRVAESNGRVGVAVRLLGTDAVLGEHAGEISVYPDAVGPGASLLLSPSAFGLEDYVAFVRPPPEPELEYRIVLDASVAGLRLVDRVLELLDASGTPRLRMARPSMLGADGVLASAELSVIDCAVDDDPAPPRGAPRVAPGAAECGVRVSWYGPGVDYPALLDPAWTTTASLSEPRQSFASVRLADGRVLAAGGVSSEAAAPLASAELYDPLTGTWAVTGSLDAARSHFTLTATAFDDAATDPATEPEGLPDASPGEAPHAGAIAVGGDGVDGALGSTELYDAISGTWAPGPSLPFASAGHAAVSLPDGTLLIAGGSAPRASARLGAGASSWQSAGTLRADEPGASLTLLDDGSVLLVGPNPPRAQRYRSTEFAWAASGSSSIARSGHTATRLLDGQVLLVGGGTQRVELYDPTSRTFRFTGGTTAPHVGHSATLLADGRVAIIGGTAGASAGGTELYDPAWGTWTPGPGTAAARASHRAERLDDGRVLAFGGADASATPPGAVPAAAALASAELLDPAPVPVSTSEYQLPPRVDPSVTSRTFTELWASITRPTTLAAGRRYPLLLFLHGNHGTCGTGQNPRRDYDCSYTTRGTCPDGFVVVPNHRGYDYAATALAARGFIVVSVNANRGITCGDGDEGDFGFNLARGRLLLRHLQQLAEWDRGEAETPASLGVSLMGKLDFNALGLMGHSRGGEGARAAYEQYREAGSPWPRR
ncbi:MAG TPA: kelch repeat-containing protein, partial [Polyangiaceae bacterium]|nr:kelch repeat-containing protein [Polyangiaceae bacterium]